MYVYLIINSYVAAVVLVTVMSKITWQHQVVQSTRGICMYLQRLLLIAELKSEASNRDAPVAVSVYVGMYVYITTQCKLQYVHVRLCVHY